MPNREGDVRTVVEKCIRRECSNCLELATYRVGFIMENARSNPASSGYRKDDISWCSDAAAWACEACKSIIEHAPPNGMEWCATFSGDRFPHMVLHWEKVSEEIDRAIPGERT